MESAKPGKKKGIKRILFAFYYSSKGICAACRGEAAFRLELLLFLVLAPAGYYLGETGIEKALLIGSLFIVLIVEILNSAIESVVDRIGEEFHQLSGQAKDMGSGAVLISLVFVSVTWLLVLLT